MLTSKEGLAMCFFACYVPGVATIPICNHEESFLPPYNTRVSGLKHSGKYPIT